MTPLDLVVIELANLRNKVEDLEQKLKMCVEVLEQIPNRKVKGKDYTVQNVLDRVKE